MSSRRGGGEWGVPRPREPGNTASVLGYRERTREGPNEGPACVECMCAMVCVQGATGTGVRR